MRGAKPKTQTKSSTMVRGSARSLEYVGLVQEDKSVLSFSMKVIKGGGFFIRCVNPWLSEWSPKYGRECLPRRAQHVLSRPKDLALSVHKHIRQSRSRRMRVQQDRRYSESTREARLDGGITNDCRLDADGAHNEQHGV